MAKVAERFVREPVEAAAPQFSKTRHGSDVEERTPAEERAEGDVQLSEVVHALQRRKAFVADASTQPDVLHKAAYDAW